MKRIVGSCGLILAGFVMLGLRGDSTPGGQLVEDTEGFMAVVAGNGLLDFANMANECGAKLGALDDRGATAERLNQEADKCLAKLARAYSKADSLVVKTSKATMKRLVDLDELDLVDQITSIQAARITAINDLGDHIDTAQTIIKDRLQEEILD